MGSPKRPNFSKMIEIGKGQAGIVYLDPKTNTLYKVNRRTPLKKTEIAYGRLAGRLGVGPKVKPSKNSKVLAMEFLKGYKTLCSYWSSQATEAPTPLQTKIARIGICKWVFLVKKGIVHNDTHCENVMYKGSSVKIIDYGSAKEATPLNIVANAIHTTRFIRQLLAPALGGISSRKFKTSPTASYLMDLNKKYGQKGQRPYRELKVFDETTLERMAKKIVGGLTKEFCIKTQEHESFSERRV